MRFRELPGRLVAGAYILHAGLEKWRADENRAAVLHGVAAVAYPQLGQIEPARFVRMLALGEIVTGALLLTPFVPASVAGGALTGFSGALVGLYARTPEMRRPGSIWPTREGTALSKDSWILAIGLGLLADAWASRRRRA